MNRLREGRNGTLFIHFHGYQHPHLHDLRSFDTNAVIVFSTIQMDCSTVVFHLTFEFLVS